jgi:hypothetical protein
MSPDAARREVLRQRYLVELGESGLDRFFQPLAERVTLSTDVGVFKPDPLIFRTALDRLGAGIPFPHAVFVTERAAHVEAARALGMMAVHFRGPGEATGDVTTLAALLPHLRRMLAFSPCHKTPAGAGGRSASVVGKARRLDPRVSALVDQVDPQRLRRRIEALGSFGTRWTYSATVARVPEWIRDRFLEIGYPAGDVRMQPFDVPGRSRQHNVLCGPDGAHPGFVLVCAHYDSLSESPGTSAPGADDNASGLAVLLEAAELLRSVTLRRGVLFAAFGGEEQGLLGSMACAEVAAAEGWRIDVVLNLDMVAYQDPGRPHVVIVEYDQGNRNPGNDAAAKAFGLMMAQAAADHTNLSIEHTDIWNSDYMPFEAKGYACIGVFEGSENPGYHKTADTVDVLDMDHLAQVAKMVAATLYRIAG